MLQNQNPLIFSMHSFKAINYRFENNATDNALIVWESHELPFRCIIGYLLIGANRRQIFALSLLFPVLQRSSQSERSLSIDIIDANIGCTGTMEQFIDHFNRTWLYQDSLEYNDT